MCTLNCIINQSLVKLTLNGTTGQCPKRDVAGDCCLGHTCWMVKNVHLLVLRRNCATVDHRLSIRVCYKTAQKCAKILHFDIKVNACFWTGGTVHFQTFPVTLWGEETPPYLILCAFGTRTSAPTFKSWFTYLFKWCLPKVNYSSAMK